MEDRSEDDSSFERSDDSVTAVVAAPESAISVCVCVCLRVKMVCVSEEEESVVKTGGKEIGKILE